MKMQPLALVTRTVLRMFLMWILLLAGALFLANEVEYEGVQKIVGT